MGYLATMATVHEIATVAHKLTTSDGELWAILLPSLVASIVPGGAIIVTWLQSRRSAQLAERQLELSGKQLEASNEIQKRQGDMRERELELTAAKQVHESREDLYQAWKALNDAAWDVRDAFIQYAPGDSGNAKERHAASREFADAHLRMRFLFGNDVISLVDELKALNESLRAAGRDMGRPSVSSEADTAREEALTSSDKGVSDKINEIREAVRAYTVHGLRKP